MDYRSADETVRAWVQANGCKEEPVVEELPDTANDGTRVTRATFGGGRDGSEVVLVTIHGGGHTWPGAAARDQSLGRSTRNVSVNDLMWEFFERHRLG